MNSEESAQGEEVIHRVEHELSTGSVDCTREYARWLWGRPGTSHLASESLALERNEIKKWVRDWTVPDQ